MTAVTINRLIILVVVHQARKCGIITGSRRPVIGRATGHVTLRCRCVVRRSVSGACLGSVTTCTNVVPTTAPALDRPAIAYGSESSVRQIAIIISRLSTHIDATYTDWPPDFRFHRLNWQLACQFFSANNISYRIVFI